jgi:nucleoside-diphosphate-sugar epimerase
MTDVLVTGGGGYIGSVLVPLLLTDDRVSSVRILDSFVDGSPRALAGHLGDGTLDIVEGDIVESTPVERAMQDIDVVIHLAAITGAGASHGRTDQTFRVNATGTATLLNVATESDVGRFVFASSCNVYGRSETADISETTAAAPINPYAESKLNAERLVRDASTAGPMTTTSLRMSTVFGAAPGIRFNLVVNQFVFRAMTGRRLSVYGDGSNWRPFIHVEDAARAYRDAALVPDRWPADIYNVGVDDQNMQIRELASVVREQVGAVDMEYLEQERPGPSYRVNFDRLDETGYEPRWEISAGISDLESWLRGNGHGRGALA